MTEYIYIIKDKPINICVYQIYVHMYKINCLLSLDLIINDFKNDSLT